MSTPLTLPQSAPRQLTRKELRDNWPVHYSYDPKTQKVEVSREWQRANIVRVDVVPGSVAWLHKAAAPVFCEWLARIRAAKLESRIVTVNGGFVPRVMRGAKLPRGQQLNADSVFAFLSRHTQGIALDLNAAQNRRGTHGAQPGQLGCVHELAALAYPLGIVWGGAWRGGSEDPMHFELGSLLRAK